LELIEAGAHFQCRLDVATGKATLHAADLPDGLSASADTRIKGPGVYNVAFSNVDDELLLWVDGKVVAFDGTTTYDSKKLPGLEERDADFSPAGIASQGAAIKVDRLCILRDLYYLPYDTSQFAGRNGETYRLEQDQFFVLGDNSARSADARFWQGEHYVQRDLLIGKALYIYWPHSWDTPVPFFPNFARMGFVR
ncbi:MAG: S26 family signal peptidase, partial [Pirellulales bacterium]